MARRDDSKARAAAEVKDVSHAYPFRGPRPLRPLARERGGDVGAVGGKLLHHLAVQPDVHLAAPVERAGIAELGGERLAVVEARIKIEQLHQIDDRALPVELGIALSLKLRGERRLDVDA